MKHLVRLTDVQVAMWRQAFKLPVAVICSLLFCGKTDKQSLELLGMYRGLADHNSLNSFKEVV